MFKLLLWLTHVMQSTQFKHFPVLHLSTTSNRFHRTPVCVYIKWHFTHFHLTLPMTPSAPVRASYTTDTSHALSFLTTKTIKTTFHNFCFLDAIYFSCSLCSRCPQSSTPFSFFSSFFSRFSFTRIACMENGTYAPFSSSLPLLLSLSALLTATSNASAVNFP